MFDLDKFKTGEYYVHLPTKELHDEVMEFLDKNGFVWAWSRESLKTKTYWDKYKEKLSINCVDGGIKYGRKSYYEEQLHLKELKINKEENTMKLEDFIKKHGNVHVDEKELKELLGIKDKKYFIPNEGTMYYYVTSRGDKAFTKNNDTEFDEDIYANNEVFRTEEEAQEHAKKQRFLLKMKRDFLDNSDDVDWENGDQEKYYLRYDHIEKKILVTSCWTYQVFGFITTDRNWLERYVEEHEEEIKKYYFGIDEQ